ncbi:hypothetical protein BDV29DRAFT_178444 [Aspergillus leporis]|uniref:Uncharacterized protein n=1 Tax=Aspergillus leporis TaxID=41062 RepID=A0A5N5WVQ1_9EURO|nr:hypothetical protein BDV29DRAFT_178444 [Aspergillus leporis]
MSIDNLNLFLQVDMSIQSSKSIQYVEVIIIVQAGSTLTISPYSLLRGDAVNIIVGTPVPPNIHVRLLSDYYYFFNRVLKIDQLVPWENRSYQPKRTLPFSPSSLCEHTRSMCFVIRFARAPFSFPNYRSWGRNSKCRRYRTISLSFSKA